MTPTQFAIAIVFPGVGIKEVVSAAIKSQVHIVDREFYNPAKDYGAFSASYEPYLNGSRIMLLFVFPEGAFILASSDELLTKAFAKIEELHSENDYSNLPDYEQMN